MTEYIKIIIPLVTALGGWEFVKYLINRKANKRKASAEAESLELNNQQDEVERLEERLKVRDAKIDKIYLEFRESQNQCIELTAKLHEHELKIAVSEIQKCEKRGCVKRTPPSNY